MTRLVSVTQGWPTHGNCSFVTDRGLLPFTLPHTVFAVLGMEPWALTQLLQQSALRGTSLPTPSSASLFWAGPLHLSILTQAAAT